MSSDHSEIDFKALCSWIVATCDPLTDSVGLAICDGGELEEKLRAEFADALKPFGFETASFSECDILLAIDISLGPRMKDMPPRGNSLKVLADFRQNKTQRMFFFCPPSRLKTDFIKTILDIDTNLLDVSIILPGKFFLNDLETQFALLILDKSRVDDGRNDITFIDTTYLHSAKLKAAMASGEAESVRSFFEGVFNGNYPKAKKDFREIIIREEPVLAFYHCTGQALQKVLNGKHTRLEKCADITKSPSYLHHLNDNKTVELSCLSPRDFAAYGYTSPPSSAETKAFPKCRIRNAQLLKPNDILLVVQRNIGKICIIEPSFSGNAWTGASFTYIIRPEDPKMLDPRVLYMYLASEMVREYLAACCVGNSGVPLLPVQALTKLPVPLFSDTEKKGMIEAFNELDKANRTISQLSRKFYSAL